MHSTKNTLEDASDLLAERLGALGGTADGRSIQGSQA
jgi:DNA-binding ferritin-like protein